MEQFFCQADGFDDGVLFLNKEENMIKKWVHLIFAACLSMAFIGNAAAETPTAASPFSKHSKLLEIDQITVYGANASLFTPYDASMPAPENGDDPEVVRTRHGVLQLSSSLKAYLDYINDPMGGTVELLEVGSGKVIGKLDDSYYTIETIDIDGSGRLYVYQVPRELCRGRTTYNYELSGDTLKEVPQPLYYVNEQTKVMLGEDTPSLALLLEAQAGSAQVATLQADTEVTLVGVKYSPEATENWFLIKTSMDISGWVPSVPQTLDIVMCN